MSEDEEQFMALLEADVEQRLKAADDNFFEEDEPVEDVLAAFEAGEQVLTEPPTRGVGWCAPSP